MYEGQFAPVLALQPATTLPLAAGAGASEQPAAWREVLVQRAARAEDKLRAACKEAKYALQELRLLRGCDGEGTAAGALELHQRPCSDPLSGGLRRAAQPSSQRRNAAAADSPSKHMSFSIGSRSWAESSPEENDMDTYHTSSSNRRPGLFMYCADCGAAGHATKLYVDHVDRSWYCASCWYAVCHEYPQDNMQPDITLDVPRIVLGRYEVYDSDLLGRGGFSVVRRGKDVLNGTPVAVKCYTTLESSDERLSDPDTLEFFLHKFAHEVAAFQHLHSDAEPMKQAAAASQSSTSERRSSWYFPKALETSEGQHLMANFAGLPPTLDLFVGLVDYSRSGDGQVAAAGDGICYMVLEVAEYTLEQFMRWRRRSGVPFGAEDLLDITRQCSQAVAVLHAKGFVHCDLKPANFMRFAKHDRWKLIDMDGIVPTGGAVYLCDVFYTPQYTSPEFAAAVIGAEDIIHVSRLLDVWSLGMIFCELVTFAQVVGAKFNELTPPTTDDEQVAGIPWLAFLQWLVNPESVVAVPQEVFDFNPRLGDLCTMMIERAPELRVSMIEVLLHPYLAGDTAEALALSSEKRLESGKASTMPAGFAGALTQSAGRGRAESFQLAIPLQQGLRHSAPELPSCGKRGPATHSLENDVESTAAPTSALRQRSAQPVLPEPSGQQQPQAQSSCSHSRRGRLPRREDDEAKRWEEHMAAAEGQGAEAEALSVERKRQQQAAQALGWGAVAAPAATGEPLRNTQAGQLIEGSQAGGDDDAVLLRIECLQQELASAEGQLRDVDAVLGRSARRNKQAKGGSVQQMPAKTLAAPVVGVPVYPLGVLAAKAQTPVPRQPASVSSQQRGLEALLEAEQVANREVLERAERAQKETAQMEVHLRELQENAAALVAGLLGPAILTQPVELPQGVSGVGDIAHRQLLF
eukprot:TRINITY_DN64087_c0_g1_i1.p1 TRINITY_DN64087_c0_g1~~TRINITY_DN64087_c0_g1_i1.p1  ORF type:complete len:919 (+),score=225.60 TRINITY_DN64087_c0_g1_i1:41-2797(+)